MTLIKSCGKGTRLDSRKIFYIENDQQEGLLIEEHDIPDLNSLFTLEQVRQQNGTGTQADRYTNNCTHSPMHSLVVHLTHTHTHTPESFHLCKQRLTANCTRHLALDEPLALTLLLILSPIFFLKHHNGV